MYNNNIYVVDRNARFSLSLPLLLFSTLISFTSFILQSFVWFYRTGHKCFVSLLSKEYFILMLFENVNGSSDVVVFYVLCVFVCIAICS